MKYETFMSRLGTKKNGAFFSCTWERPMKTKKGVNSLITKEVTSTVRKGIDRRNLAKFRLGHETYKEGPLPWGSWKEGQEGLILQHITKDGELKNYVRLYTTTNKPKVKFFINGREVPKECIEKLVLKSELNTSDISDCFSVNIENIKNIR
jgi:hypothetical protein